jgi:NADH-quinone oxidoreductase subunit L
MFVGWEGVGLCSYLLIGYYFDKKEAGDAAKKAFITNRIGDWGFVLGIMLTFFITGSVSFFANPAAGEAAQTALSYFKTQGVEPFTFGAIFAGGATSIAVLLFIGAAGKSAQIPLYVWLPDAMAGPTPVSALIHAATMVTAGVYMIVRCSEIFVHAPTAMFIVAIVGAATALFAATIGLAQNDIKKVLAYSTISQLGYMFLACGVGAFIAAIFHVITHAFFKALLFLGSGSVIHGTHHEQDMRRMGGLRKYMPITYVTMLIGWLAISGIPVFAGFFSKDEILWKTWSAAGLGSFSKVLWVVGAITALLTAVYMTRMMAMTFWGKERFDAHHHKPHESPLTMTVPLIVLAILSTVGGFIGIPYAFVNRDINVIEHTLEPVVAHAPEAVTTDHADEHAHVGEERVLAGVSVAIALLGIGIGWVLFQRQPLRQLPRLLENTLIRPIEATSREGLWKIIDKGVIDGLLHSIGDAVTELGRLARYLQAGFVRGYAAIILLGALILIGLFAYLGYR